MTKVLIELEDVDGELALNTEFMGGFDDQSFACQATVKIIAYLDAIAVNRSHGPQDVEPRMVKTMQEVNAARAQTVAHLKSEPQIILAH